MALIQAREPGPHFASRQSGARVDRHLRRPISPRGPRRRPTRPMRPGPGRLPGCVIRAECGSWPRPSSGPIPQPERVMAAAPEPLCLPHARRVKVFGPGKNSVCPRVSRWRERHLTSTGCVSRTFVIRTCVVSHLLCRRTGVKRGHRSDPRTGLAGGTRCFGERV